MAAYSVFQINVQQSVELVAGHRKTFVESLATSTACSTDHNRTHCKRLVLGYCNVVGKRALTASRCRRNVQQWLFDSEQRGRLL